MVLREGVKPLRERLPPWVAAGKRHLPKRGLSSANSSTQIPLKEASATLQELCATSNNTPPTYYSSTLCDLQINEPEEYKPGLSCCRTEN